MFSYYRMCSLTWYRYLNIRRIRIDTLHEFAPSLLLRVQRKRLTQFFSFFFFLFSFLSQQVSHSSLLRVQRECVRKREAAESKEPRALAAQVAVLRRKVPFKRDLLI